MDLRRERRKGIKKQNILIVILLIVIIALGAIIFMFFMAKDMSKPPENTSIGAPINGSIEGLDTVPNPNPSEIFQYKLNRSIYIKDVSEPCEIMLENSEGNSYAMLAEYKLNSTGEVLFVTDRIMPNQYIGFKDIGFPSHDIDVQKGTHDVTVYMMIMDISTDEVVTTIEENIKLYVGEGKGGN